MPLHQHLRWTTTNNCETIPTMIALPDNQKTTKTMPLMLKRINKTMTTQRKLLFWSSKHTAAIISEMFGGVLL